MNLTARSVANLKPEATARYVMDDSGAALRIGAAADGGAKSWSMRYRFGRRLRRLTLGKFPALSLADARAAVRDARKKIAKGIDPAEEKIAAREADTVGEFVKTFLERQKKKNKSWQDGEANFNKDVLPAWRHRLLMTDISRHATSASLA